MINWYEALKAQNRIPVNDRLTQMFGATTQGTVWTVSTITGTLPITFRSNGTALINYRIYGTSDGAGEETKNLVSLDGVNDSTSNGITYTVNSAAGTITVNRTGTASNNSTKIFSVTLPAGDYVFTCGENSERDVTYDSYLRIGGSSPVTIARDNPNDPPGSAFILTETTTMLLYIRIRPQYNAHNLVFKPMVRPADTTPDFIPYGYQIPLTLTNGTKNKTSDIFIGDSKLGASDYVDYETQTITRGGISEPAPFPLPEISTYKGTNTLDSTETLGEVTIKGKIKEAE